MIREVKSSPESIRARLLNRARTEGVEFQQLLTRFALERLLYRLSVSEYRDQFLLKGALLFNLWYSEPQRPTRDVDFLGFGPDDPLRIEGIFRELCAIPALDGISFDTASIKSSTIRLDANYGGVRITLVGLLAGARCPIQADIGFGDAITPEPEEATYPTMLADLPAPNLRVYPKYTVIAEKLHAVVELGMENTRMKDYFDLWILLRDPALEKSLIRSAVRATFSRRDRKLPEEIPIGFSVEFATDERKVTQWNTFLARNRLQAPELAPLLDRLRELALALFEPER